jgi:hypothetical protein
MKVSDLLLRSVMLAGTIQATDALAQWQGCADDTYYGGCSDCWCVDRATQNWLMCTSDESCNSSCGVVPWPYCS